MTIRIHLRRLILMLALTGPLTGCGQKGPLVLPGPQTEPVTEEAGTAEEDNEQESETDDE